MTGKYQVLVQKIQKSPLQANLWWAVCAYTLMVLGLWYFVLPQIKSTQDVWLAVLFGIIVYGIYDFTCAAIFQDWDIQLMLIDVAWGGFVYGMAVYLALKF